MQKKTIHITLTSTEATVLDSIPIKRVRGAVIRRLIRAYGEYEKRNGNSALSDTLKGDIKLTKRSYP